MNEIMTVDQMDALINAVSALLAAAAPGLDISVDEMNMPNCQPVAYVWAGDRGGISITGTADNEAIYAPVDDLCVSYRTYGSADEAVRKLIGSAPRNGRSPPDPGRPTPDTAATEW